MAQMRVRPSKSASVMGAVIGAGGTVAATEGKEVELPQGTVLRVRFDTPVQLNR